MSGPDPSAAPDPFAGRGAFVSGAASGIGLATARALAQRGMKVVLADIDGAGAAAAAADIPGAHAVTLDVRDRAGWSAAYDEAERLVGPLAVIVSNAGVAGSILPLAETSAEAWEWTRSVNLDGVFHSLSLGLSRLLRSGGPAHFVATASLGAMLVWPANGVYCATKAAIVALCEAARTETAGTGVRISVLLPGVVRTAILEANDSRAPAGVDIGARLPDVEQLLREGKDPAEVGRIITDALGTDRFWLFTHPEAAPQVAARAEEIAAALHF